MYSVKFRKEVLKALEKKGNSIKKVAQMFGIGSDTISRWKRSVIPKRVGGTHRKIDLEELKEDVRKYPDAYQYERAKRFGVYQNAIFCALKRIGVSYKKKSNTQQKR